MTPPPKSTKTHNQKDKMKTKAKSVTVIGRRWRDKINGNTYHSARVFVDGACVASVPFQYGYGNQFEWNAADALEKSGTFKGKCSRQVDAERQRCEPAWQWLRDRLGLNYMVDVAECTKRECVAWGQP